MKRQWLSGTVLVAMFACGAAACGPGTNPDAGDGAVDAPRADRAEVGPGMDATPDASAEGGREAGPEAGPDAGPEPAVEAGVDARVDAAPDASPPDASDVVGADVALDAAADASPSDASDDAAPLPDAATPDAATPDAASDGGAPGDGGAFVRYTETRIAPACEDMSTATTLSALDDADDDVTLPAALPFTLQFFGRSVGFYSVTTNGYAQLWADALGVPSTEYSNEPIPTADDPLADDANNFVAPFWDDLTVFLPGASVRTATLGTAPARRFVIEWRDVQLYAGKGDTTLRFQAKLFEGTNVIEFHYCTLSGTDPLNADALSGGSATVGLENEPGTAGIQHSHDTPGSVRTTDAIRFTP